MMLSAPAALLLFQLTARSAGKAGGDGPNAWIPTDGVPSCWLRPGPAPPVVVIQLLNQQVQELCLSVFPLSNINTLWQPKQQKLQMNHCAAPSICTVLYVKYI